LDGVGAELRQSLQAYNTRLQELERGLDDMRNRNCASRSPRPGEETAPTETNRLYLECVRGIRGYQEQAAACGRLTLQVQDVQQKQRELGEARALCVRARDNLQFDLTQETNRANVMSMRRIVDTLDLAYRPDRYPNRSDQLGASIRTATAYSLNHVVNTECNPERLPAGVDVPTRHPTSSSTH
jgi:hypothetical protein